MRIMKNLTLLMCLMMQWSPTIATLAFVGMHPLQSRSMSKSWLFSGRQDADPAAIEVSRRSVIGSSMAITTIILSSIKSVAAEGGPSPLPNQKPFAPLINLLPATRVKLWIDSAVATASALVELESKSDKKKQTTADLKQILLEPKTYILTQEEEVAARNYLDQRTWGAWKKARQQEARVIFQIENVDPVTSAVEAFEQWGERGQFKRLQSQRVALDKANNMRAAFNAYTNNLVFGDGVQINASKQDKSRLIRQYDQLPDATTTIRSDLDLRDLYRNQVLNAWDDAKAELEYQLKNSNGEIEDATEMLTLLRGAQASCSEWFAFIPEKDVQQALEAVQKER